MADTPTHEALKPCPFCGSDKIEEDSGDESTHYRCRNCGASSGRVYFSAGEREAEDYSLSEGIALEAWNSRAALAAADAAMGTTDDLRVIVGHAKHHGGWCVFEETSPSEFVKIKGPFPERAQAETALREPATAQPTPAALSVQAEPAPAWTVNRYCSVAMCLAGDKQHEPDCAHHNITGAPDHG